MEAAERADVALVLVDASQGVTDHDFRVADIARKAGCSTLVVLSKWDLSTVDRRRPRAISTASCASVRPPSRCRQGRGAD